MSPEAYPFFPAVLVRLITLLPVCAEPDRGHDSAISNI